ncbi:MAG: nucleotidyltransferase domain-containing protein [Chloroflexi bacterium]|nr:nucleotidyltransferase domain-containing protein [Chloroflexota bacterium]
MKFALFTHVPWPEGEQPAVLDDIIERVVEVAAPEKIIFFGSVARGEFGRNSDIDLLVVKDGEDTLSLSARIYGAMQGVGVAVDVLVVSSADVERYKDSHSLIIKPTLQEGVVVYGSV